MSDEVATDNSLMLDVEGGGEGEVVLVVRGTPCCFGGDWDERDGRFSSETRSCDFLTRSPRVP